jgi:hypothetical protein
MVFATTLEETFQVLDIFRIDWTSCLKVMIRLSFLFAYLSCSCHNWNGKTWKWLSSNDQSPIWQSLKNFTRMISTSCTIQVWKAPAVIAAKGASTKYWLRGVNNHVNKIFLYYIFYIFADISKNTFHLWAIVCRWVRKKIYWIHFEFRL